MQPLVTNVYLKIMHKINTKLDPCMNNRRGIHRTLSVSRAVGRTIGEMEMCVNGRGLDTFEEPCHHLARKTEKTKKHQNTRCVVGI